MVIGYVLRGIGVGAAVSGLWTGMALLVARWPMRLKGPKWYRKFYDLQVKLIWILVCTPPVYAAGWPALWLCGVPRAESVTLLAAGVMVVPLCALTYRLGLAGVYGLPLLPPIGYGAAAAAAPEFDPLVQVTVVGLVAAACVLALVLTGRRS